MAESLKSRYGPEIPRRIAAMIIAAYPDFDREAFLHDALAGYEALELMPRGRHMAQALRAHLPGDYPAALAILIASMAPVRPEGGNGGLAPFLYLPHARFVEDYGLAHFEPSMRALYEITRRFTAEFSIRPFLQHHPAATLARLHDWASDPCEHVRRLVSEGTRPRLPWAGRLPAFQHDPAPVLALLERLRDDPSEYVRRSVANNLNDIGKDHPEMLVTHAVRWLDDAPPARRRLITHALRSLVKAGHAGALAALGFGAGARVEIRHPSASPTVVRAGESVTLACTLHNPGRQPQPVVADLRVHFVKASGRTAPKVFKLKTLRLAPGETVLLSKRYAFVAKTTRAHHRGLHRAELLLNGVPSPLGQWEYRA